jgi:mannose-1-phosphate guanylyltransferase
MSNHDHVFAVLLAGGGGTRLWPKSRNKTPKQFLKLVGTDTMVQVAASRVTKLVSWDRVIVVTNAIYIEDIKNQLPQVPVENIIAEPEKKDTAMAMLVGALYAKSKDPEAIVMNGASDHVIEDEKEFVHVMEGAIEVATERKYLITVGITPTRPDTAFGYIKIGEQLKKVNRSLAVFKVDSFTEKPNAATAQAFLSTGKYFWNANMYVWAADSLQEAFQNYMPEMYELTKNLPEMNPDAFHAALPAIYSAAQSISIDYAISEKANNLVLIPGDFGWNDVGDWKVVYDLGKKDLAGNVITGDGEVAHTLTISAQNNLIHAGKRLIALVGVDDLIVVDTDEILLVVPKSRSQDVKKIVERLKEESKKEYL